MVEAAPSLPDCGGWQAELSLRFTADAAGFAHTRLTGREHRGPLVVQRPFYPEGPAIPHVYLLHPPGGIVGGDTLRIDVHLDPSAHALVTTPAATKVYRSRGPRSTQAQQLRVTAGAALEWLPQETILYDGAEIDLRTTVVLDEGARFVGMETLCFGLPARGETFATGRCRQRFELWRPNGRPLLIERGRFHADDAVHAAPWGLAGARVHGLMVATPFTGPATLLDELRALAASSTGDRASVTTVDEGRVLCFRYVGASTERARRFFQDAWVALRPTVIGSPAVLPRIWAT